MDVNNFFQSLLNSLFQTSPFVVCLSFLIENIAIVILVLVAGRFLQKVFAPSALAYTYNSRDWMICTVTVILNTFVTFVGYWLWKQGIIEFQVSLSFYILTDFVLLFLGMDFLMFIFHYLIHKSSLYKSMHQLHHQAVNPKPIDLFVLHPVETICFGSLWLCLLFVQPFNFYSVIIYLTLNVLFGMVGHLGLEPFPEQVQKNFIVKYIGTSTFHHDHHQYENHNFGFYTTIWDRMFGTLKR